MCRSFLEMLSPIPVSLLQVHRAPQHSNLSSPSVNHLFNFNSVPNLCHPGTLLPVINHGACAHLSHLWLRDLGEPSQPGSPKLEPNSQFQQPQEGQGRKCSSPGLRVWLHLDVQT